MASGLPRIGHTRHPPLRDERSPKSEHPSKSGQVRVAVTPSPESPFFLRSTRVATVPPMPGAITLADLAGKIAVLEVACSRCNRAGRLNVARLTRQHGPHAGLPSLRHVIAADCPRRAAVSLYDLCGVFYPQLVALFWTGGPN